MLRNETTTTPIWIAATATNRTRRVRNVLSMGGKERGLVDQEGFVRRGGFARGRIVGGIGGADDGGGDGFTIRNVAVNELGGGRPIGVERGGDLGGDGAQIGPRAGE